MRINCSQRMSLPRMDFSKVQSESPRVFLFLGISILSPRLVDLSLSYRGPNNKPFDAASLRRALNFFSGSEEMIFDWDVTYASSSQKSLPPLPPTCPRILTSSTPKLQTLHLMLQDHNPHYLPSGANPTLLTSRHMSQLLTVVVPPGLKKLELVTHLLTSNMTLAQGFSVFGDSLRGVTCEGLTRLGVTYPYSVDSRQQISHGWVRSRHLTLGCRSSDRRSSSV
jgi:hypothetical protein